MKFEAAKEKARLFVANIWTWLKEYRSKRKPVFDKYFDTSLCWLIGNAAYIYGADKLLNFVFEHANSHGSLAKLITYAGLIMGWPYVNKHLIVPVAKRVKKFHEERISQNREATALSWVRTASQLGIVLALYNLLSFGKTLNNFKYDGLRMLRAFESEERKDQQKIEEEKVASITPAKLEAEVPKSISSVDIRAINRHSYYGRFLRAYRWHRILRKVEKEFNLPYGILSALAMRESHGDPLALNANDDGGAGMFMFQPGTARRFGLKIWGDSNATGRDRNYGLRLRELVESLNWDYGKLSKVDERFDVEKSARAAAKYLREAYRQYGSWDAALSAYNCGTPCKNFRETHHVRATLLYWQCYLKNAKGLGEEVPESLPRQVDVWLEKHFPQGRIASCSSEGEDYTDLPDYYFEPCGKTSRGEEVFCYSVKKGDNPTKIAKNFNEYDARVFRDRYKEVIWRNVVNKNWRSLDFVRQNQRVYIVTRRKQAR
ncbi:MAG: transglycosylase SLT domain-containing protein [Candidatus Micrarchaeia archaeon]